MPPKPKFSKEEIIDAALDIVSRDGVAALTARELGEKLGCSSSPIFTVFKSMDEVMQAIRDEAKRRYDKYVSRARDYYPSFKAIGILMLRYAKEQPKLFQLLFMTENAQARFLFQYVWTFTYGVSAMSATGMCDFSEDELVSMLGNEFMAIMSFIKSGMYGKAMTDIRPIKRGDGALPDTRSFDEPA